VLKVPKNAQEGAPAAQDLRDLRPPFDWRKKWEKVWDEVKYCSDRCRRTAKEKS